MIYQHIYFQDNMILLQNNDWNFLKTSIIINVQKHRWIHIHVETQSVRNFSLSQCCKLEIFNNFKLADEKLRKSAALIFSEIWGRFKNKNLVQLYSLPFLPCSSTLRETSSFTQAHSLQTYLVWITGTDLQYSMSEQMKHFNTLDGSFLESAGVAYSPNFKNIFYKIQRQRRLKFPNVYSGSPPKTFSHYWILSWLKFLLVCSMVKE